MRPAPGEQILSVFVCRPSEAKILWESCGMYPAIQPIPSYSQPTPPHPTPPHPTPPFVPTGPLPPPPPPPSRLHSVSPDPSTLITVIVLNFFIFSDHLAPRVLRGGLFNCSCKLSLNFRFIWATSMSSGYWIQSMRLREFLPRLTAT